MPPRKKKSLNYLNGWFGWKIDNIIDLDDITAARGTEMMMPLWMRLFQGVVGHPHFQLPHRPRSIMLRLIASR
jgi:hypothetical protein